MALQIKNGYNLISHAVEVMNRDEVDAFAYEMKVGGMKLCPFFAKPRKGVITYSLHLWHLLVDRRICQGRSPYAS
jgi:hypothetical protein